MANFTGYGQYDTGGQAQPTIAPQTIVWQNAAPFNFFQLTGSRGPTNQGVLYQTGGGGVTPGFGQIFPTGRS